MRKKNLYNEKTSYSKNSNSSQRQKRVLRFELSANVTLARKYTCRVAAGRRRRPPRKGQRGSGSFDTLKKIAKNPLVKRLGKKALTHAPKPYK